MNSIHHIIVLSTITTIASAPAHADEISWLGPSGGFHNPASWVGGATPGASGTAIFDIGGSTHVGFLDAAQTDRAVIRHGWIIFEMFGSSEFDTDYSLLSTSSFLPSLVVGEDDSEGSDARLQLDIDSILNAPLVIVGQLDGSDGLLEMVGPNARLEIANELAVGMQGAGTVRLDSDCTLVSLNAAVGVLEGSDGAVHVEEAGAEWENFQSLTIGESGVGYVNVDAGGNVLTHDVILGLQESGQGEVDVSEPLSIWNVLGTLDVGFKGEGNLAIFDGGIMIVDEFVTIGTFFAGSASHPDPEDAATGAVFVANPGSLLVVQGDLYVGFLGNGMLTISDGGRVQVNGDLLALEPTSTVVRFNLTSDSEGELPIISVGGDVENLNLEVDLVGSYVPSLGESFTLIDAAGEILDYAITLPELPTGLDWDVDVDFADRLIITVQEIDTIPADLDLDGDVDFSDLLILLDAWGACPPGDCIADLNDSGAVGFADLLILLDSWS